MMATMCAGFGRLAHSRGQQSGLLFALVRLMPPAFDLARLTLIADALQGAGGFRPTLVLDAENRPTLVGSSYLIRYPREMDDKFARRNQVAWFVSDLMAACLRFTGYLSKRPPQRATSHPQMTALLDDCDWCGNALDVFWQQFMVQAKARGSMLLLVEKPRPGSERNIPYLVAIETERMLQFKTSEAGRLTWVEISDTLPDGRACVRGWDEAWWWVRIGEDVIEMEPHPLGVCPVLAFSESGQFPEVGEFGAIADVSKRLFNLHSELDELIRAQTFSLLAYHVPENNTQFEANKVSEAIGTHNMLIYYGNAPGFIAPPDGPARTLETRIQRLEELINRLSHQVDSPDQVESGLAMTLRFQGLNAALTRFARRMEDLERQMLNLCARWLGLGERSEAVTTAWAKDYALSDVSGELTQLQGLIDTGFPPVVLAEQRVSIANTLFSNLDPERMKELGQAILEAGADVVLPPDPDLDSPPTNLPNTKTKASV